jgi:penicillin-binding protein 1A
MNPSPAAGQPGTSVPLWRPLGSLRGIAELGSFLKSRSTRAGYAAQAWWARATTTLVRGTERARTAIATQAGRIRGSRVFRRVIVPVAALPVLAVAGFFYSIYFDRSALPDLEPFLSFRPPTIGEVYDRKGRLLIELAQEHRRVVSYDEVPTVLRDAVLAAEDRRFFSHSGVDYTALPRVAYKTARQSFGIWRKEGEFRLSFPQGGSTLTQQLVRGYFLQDLTSRENGDVLFREGVVPRLMARAIGVPATNKLLRKFEEIRLSLWLEEEMRRHYGSREAAKREIFSRYASFIYLGNGRYGFAAASSFYFDKPLASYTHEDAAEAALLAGISKSPRDYSPLPGGPRPLRRRNQILDLMARNGYIPASLAARAQAVPVHVVDRSPVKTHAPAAVENVLEELKRHGGDRFGVMDLFRGQIAVHTTVDQQVQLIVNEALEHGLAQYEKRHRAAKGLIQGSVVVLRNADGAILAESGGRQVYKDRYTRYCDYNRVTGSLRQPGSAIKPIVYLAAFREGLSLDSLVPDAPIGVPMGANRGTKWISNYDNQFKGLITARQALAESRNAVAVWLTRWVGVDKVLETARELGVNTPLQPYITTALGASEVRLLELAGAYRAIASGVLAEPHVIEKVTGPAGDVLYAAPPVRGRILDEELRPIQEGLRGVVRLSRGTAHALDGAEFPIPVMGKTGTTSDFRDALFVGSTYGTEGITVAVRVGFDDNRVLGDKETGSRAALPIFREILLRVYEKRLVGRVPQFPADIEHGIDRYVALQAALEAADEEDPLSGAPDPWIAGSLQGMPTTVAAPQASAAPAAAPVAEVPAAAGTTLVNIRH